MITKFLKEWSNFNLGNKPVLVAVSTGVDSMSLLELLQHLPQNQKPQITVAYVDHQLRIQSDMETTFIKKYCHQHHLPLVTETWQKNFHPRTGTEDAARKFRYDFFKKVMKERQISTLITAHHADDQAETFLMKLIRGGELKQLVGIQSVRPFAQKMQLVRPLLSFSKDELQQYAIQNHLHYFEDETNNEDNILRNRIRHHIIPQLKAENPQFLKHVFSYEHQLADVLKLNNEVVEHHIKEIQKGEDYDLLKWLQLNKCLQIATLKYIFENYQIMIKEDQLQQIITFLKNSQKPQGSYKINKHKQLHKEYKTFRIEKNKLQVVKDSTAYPLQLGKWVTLDNLQIGLFVKENYVPQKGQKFVGLSSLPSLWVRHRNADDYLIIDHKRKKLRRYFIDKKIKNEVRDKTWLIVDDQHLIYALLNNVQTYLSQTFKNAKIHYIIIIETRKR